MIFGKYSSPLGQINLQSSDEKSLCGLFFADDFKADFTNAKIFDDTKRWLDIYFSGVCPDFTPKLDLAGSAFSLAVWAEVRKVKYATSTSYGDIAKNLQINSARAVGTAVGKNPILLIIPCHRVLRADLSLCGYKGALWRKKELLKLEKIAFK